MRHAGPFIRSNLAARAWEDETLDTGAVARRAHASQEVMARGPTPSLGSSSSVGHRRSQDACRPGTLDRASYRPEVAAIATRGSSSVTEITIYNGVRPPVMGPPWSSGTRRAARWCHESSHMECRFKLMGRLRLCGTRSAGNWKLSLCVGHGPLHLNDDASQLLPTSHRPPSTQKRPI